MTFSLDFPAGPMAEAALSVVRTSESPSIANHSVRSFFFAQLLAAHEGSTPRAVRRAGALP
jgi:hypothetical protein